MIYAGEMIKGDTFKMDFNLQQPDGSPQVLTDCTIAWGCASADEPTTPYILKGVGDGITVLDADEGQIRVIVAGSAFTRLGQHFFDVQVQLPSGEVFTQIQGMFQIRDGMNVLELLS